MAKAMRVGIKARRRARGEHEISIRRLARGKGPQAYKLRTVAIQSGGHLLRGTITSNA